MTFYSNLIWRLLAFLAIPTLIIAQDIPKPDSTDKYATFGVRINQKLPYGIIGVTIHTTGNLYFFSGTDLGGKDRAFFTMAAYRFFRSGKFSIFALIGPNSETITPDTPEAEPTTYLTAATSFALNYQVNPDLNTVIAISYLITDNEMIKWKFAFALSIPLRI